MGEGSRSILVFGATGRQGGSVVDALLRAQWPVRAFVRDASAPKAVALGDAGAELVQGSLSDPGAVRKAMSGVHGVFSVLPSNLPEDEEVRCGTGIADVAAESGIAHFVYSSGASVGEKPTGVARFDAKLRIEAHVRALPLTSTIVRPTIFMEMLLPGYGLDEGRFTFFLKPDQSMQLVAVEDIGKLVAAIFADRPRFAGKTLRLASDTVTGRELGEAFTAAAGRPIAYERFSDEVLAAKPDLGHMATSLEAGPLADHVDLAVMRELYPDLRPFPSWLAGDGHEGFAEALKTGGDSVGSQK